jgi:hypothetical protein
MSEKTFDVPLMSRETGESAESVEVIDAVELARRLGVPPSWVRSRTRQRTPRTERLPCLRFGRYIRFAWNSTALISWLKAHEQQ